jgi:hypothetical protein
MMSRFIVYGLVGLGVACSSSPKSPGASAGESATAGASSTTGGASGGAVQNQSGAIAATGNSASAGAGTGSPGATTGTGTAATGAGSSGAATSPTDAGATPTPDATMTTPPADAGSFPTFVDGGACPANAIMCDDFEEYPALVNPPGGLDLTQMLPNWDQYSFHGFPRVDNVPPLLPGKTHSAYLDTEASSYRFAAFIRQTPDGVPVVPLAHYGRVMANIKAVSPMSQWTIIELQGLLPGSTTELATFNFGGNKGHLAAGYSQRKRVLDSDGGVTLRPGGPINAQEAAMGTLDCTKTATTETMTTGKWVCIEWNIDATKSEMHFWLDGVAQTEIDVSGQGTECSIGMPTTPWVGPTVFTKLNLVWEGYGTDSPGQDIGYDEFAVGEQRIGCPP